MSQLIRAVYRILELIRIANKQDSWKLQEVSGLSRLTKATLHSLLFVRQNSEW